MRAVVALVAIAALAACKDESVASYGGADTLWQLKEISGKGFDARATLRLEKSGAVSGQAPCNSYRAEQSAPYPWFKLSPILSTKMACPDLDKETAFFSALSSMTLSEVSGNVLVLSNDAGEEMVFEP